MPADFRSLSLTLPGGSGTKVVEDTAVFSGTVRRADCTLKGILFDYASSDHHINVVEATSSVISVNGNTVRVRAVCRYADQNFDDAYGGSVRVLVVADVA